MWNYEIIRMLDQEKRKKKIIKTSLLKKLE